MRPERVVFLFVSGKYRGRIEATNLELLTKVILLHWRPPEIDLEKVILNKVNEDKSQNDRGLQYYY